MNRDTPLLGRWWTLRNASYNMLRTLALVYRYYLYGCSLPHMAACPWACMDILGIKLQEAPGVPRFKGNCSRPAGLLRAGELG